MNKEQLEGLVRATFMTFTMVRKYVNEHRDLSIKIDNCLLGIDNNNYSVYIMRRNRVDRDVVEALKFCWHDEYLDYFVHYYKRRVKKFR